MVWQWALALALVLGGPAVAAPREVIMENEYARLNVGQSARVTLVDRATGHDVVAGPAALAAVRVAGKLHPATAARRSGDKLTLAFGDTGCKATIEVRAEPHAFIVEVLSVEGRGIEELRFLDVPLALEGTLDEPFSCCLLALNLRTRVPDLPGPQKALQASCFPRFGFAGARAALIACPTDQLRSVMQEVVAAAPQVPKSSIGGPWALGQEINQGSYLFNFGNLTEQTVDEWIDLARQLGLNQIDFHGGGSFRFGDIRPNPDMYPQGLASMKRVIDRLHAAGIKAGLHTYAFFIDKGCPWVTPRPDPRLAKDAVFTLARPLDASADALAVAESTAGMSTTTGFFVQNSVLLQIDDELIEYGAVGKKGFTACKRGALGTTAAPHAVGARVYHLKEMFGLLVPDPDTTLLAEVAARTAQAFNQAGFDMMYLDALDGESILGGPENGWHYGSKFVWEIWQRLERPALMEMSTFHHLLWYVRSRAGAWDHPNRSHKRFIDLHVAGNAGTAGTFLPATLGWWAVKTWSGAQGEPTFSDDIEYLCAKCLGTDTGLALMGVDPATIKSVPALARLGGIMQRWEGLRHSGRVPVAIKEQLAQPGADFTLEGDARKWQLRPVHYDRHKVEGMDGWSDHWQVDNPHGAQPAGLRIEALLSVKPGEPGQVLLDPAQPDTLAERSAQAGVTLGLAAGAPAGGPAGGTLSLGNSRGSSDGAWASAGRRFDPPLDLSARQGLVVAVHGDGRGELLNLQLRCPSHVVAGIGDHYIKVDFTGWRTFTLVEPEGERWAEHQWPYGGAYAIYRENIDYGQVSQVSLWVNDLPAGGQAEVGVGPVMAVPLVETTLHHPAVTIGKQTITFPVDMPTGSYLEYAGSGDATLYGKDGAVLATVTPHGEPPTLAKGSNDIEFAATTPDGASPRARVTIISKGEALKP